MDGSGTARAAVSAGRHRATLVASPGVARLAHLAAFLPEVETLVRTPGRAVDSVAGWGLKPTSAAARRYAARRGLPYLALEDGFLRSVGLGELGAPPLSLVVDDLGIYYDATRPSRLERLIAEAPAWADPALLARARAAIDRIVETGLAKTNAAPPLPQGALGPRGRRRVLVVDQTFGDASITYGLADTDSFRRMLETAVHDEPDAEIWVRRHPAVSAGAKRGCLPLDLPAGVRVVDVDCRPADLLAEVDAVYVVTSLLGFEALLRGLPVRCFGAPFYSGWGLTRDEVDTGRRGESRSLETVFAAAYLRYARYVDPVTGAPCELEQAIERLLLFRDRAQAHAGYTACLGFAPWKHGAARALLGSPLGRVEFFASAERAGAAAAREGGRVVYWAARETPEMVAALDAHGAKAMRMEDGFVRSAGLGSDFHRAASVALDDLGVYYDATRPSRLERILETAEFPPALLARARRVREAIVRGGLSKYNLSGGAPATADWPTDRARVLVVGQVENDKSIAKGCVDVRTNADLLERVRRERPEAFIVYKEHPDVTSGNRPGRLSEAASALADRRADDLDIAAVLPVIDEVSTMTSLTGFEALLRGKTVNTYGRPFYAGWGLTRDALECPRRTRRLTLDELAAAALILYPTYVSPRTGAPCEVEDVIAELAPGRAQAETRARRRFRYWRAVWETLRGGAAASY